MRFDFMLTPPFSNIDLLNRSPLPPSKVTIYCWQICSMPRGQIYGNRHHPSFGINSNTLVNLDYEVMYIYCYDGSMNDKDIYYKDLY